MHLFFEECLMIIINKRSCIFRSGFFEDIFPVRPYCFIAYEKFFRNFVVGESLHDQAKHFDLAHRKLLMVDFKLAIDFFIDDKHGSIIITHFHIKG